MGNSLDALLEALFAGSFICWNNSRLNPISPKLEDKLRLKASCFDVGARTSQTKGTNNPGRWTPHFVDMWVYCVNMVASFAVTLFQDVSRNAIMLKWKVGGKSSRKWRVACDDRQNDDERVCRVWVTIDNEEWRMTIVEWRFTIHEATDELGKKRRESSKGNCYIISSKVIIKAITISHSGDWRLASAMWRDSEREERSDSTETQFAPSWILVIMPFAQGCLILAQGSSVTFKALYVGPGVLRFFFIVSCVWQWISMSVQTWRHALAFSRIVGSSIC